MTDPARYDLPDCAAFDAQAPDEDTAVDRFLALYPEELVSPAGAEATALSPAQLTEVVAFTACASARAGPGPDVPETALALFTSRRHGAAALAVLDWLAAGGGEDGRAARAFADQMRDFAREPEG